ncbi:MAG: winged helix-turn-helix domain-containing protein [Gaiellaceae bacterium]
MERVSLAQLRRYVVACQGYAGRFRRGGADDVEAAIRRLSAVQLDSITTVDRSHRIALGCRVGAYPRGTVSALLGQGRIFEYWAHEACLLPIETYPLFRTKMGVANRWGSYVRALRDHADLIPYVLGEIRERGPLGSRHFGGAGGGMWDWKPAKMVLDALWDRGDLVIAGRQGFQRLYDLAERVIPRAVLEAPAPDEAGYLHALSSLAIHARGALTNYGVREHWRLKGGAALVAPHLESLCAEGRIRRVEVDDGGPPVFVPAAAVIDGAPRAAVLLSPFDNLLWDRPFSERLFGFKHVIEVYKREHERVYGYYVLPFLLGDRLAGRADLKADRAEGLLRVRAFHVEPGVRASAGLEAGFERALERLARTLGLAAARPH